MPPKKSKAKAPGAQAKQQQVDEQEQKYTAELHDLATQARRDGTSSASLTSFLRAAAILTLLGIYSNVSQLTLSPVYGGIPASVYHAQVLMAGCFVGWAANLALRHVPLPLTTGQLLAVMAAYVPVLQMALFPLSERLGAKMGPIVTEGLTLFPIAVLSAACVADELEGVEMSRLPSFVADAAPGLGSWTVFKVAEALSGRFLGRYVGALLVLTRIVMESLLSAAYTALFPSRVVALAMLPGLLHTAVLNPHVMTSSATTGLNTTLEADGWLLLDRRESVTGYLSVIESQERGFRVMRCDHSLLGGQWQIIKGPQVAEPIYSVFAMLEAVRLVESREKVADKDAKALVIGLGIGTTPSAFVAHGIDTTVVEIDPVVHELASKYFELRENNEPVLKDAVSYTAGLVKAEKTFDYIIHDVFTGGAEPVDLFTLEFLQGLSDLLSPQGVIAINYAGDFSLPAPKIVVRTITQVFPTCRIFRESPIKEDIKEGEADFTNMVIFCQKQSDEKLRFRPAVVEDFLQSRSRQMFLEPKNEIQQLDFLNDGEGSTEILRKNETGKMAGWHRTTATGHWEIMRTVLPPRIWEMW